MTVQHGSMWALERLVRTWPEGARNVEVERVITILKLVLWGRGRDLPCDPRKPDSLTEGGAARRPVVGRFAASQLVARG